MRTITQIILHQHYRFANNVNVLDCTFLIKKLVSETFKNIHLYRLFGGVCLQITNTKSEIYSPGEFTHTL